MSDPIREFPPDRTLQCPNCGGDVNTADAPYRKLCRCGCGSARFFDIPCRGCGEEITITAHSPNARQWGESAVGKLLGSAVRLQDLMREILDPTTTATAPDAAAAAAAAADLMRAPTRSAVSHEKEGAAKHSTIEDLTR